MKTKKEKLPDDTNEIEYGHEKNNADFGKVTTNLFYDCGCEYKIIWFDIKSGKIHAIIVEDICETHDPTIPFVKDDNNE